MKRKVLVFFMSVMMLTGLATGQNQPDIQKPASDAKNPLFFIKLATSIAAQVHPVDGYMAIYIDQTTWSAALKDGDLGPFAKFKDAKSGRSVTCLFSQSKSVVTCVYFDADKPFGVVSVLARVNGKINSGDVSAAYKKFSKDMLKESPDAHISFTPNEVLSDDGTKLAAYLVSNPTKVKN